jgi:hypothetical protein
LQPVAFGYSRTLGRTRPKKHERSDPKVAVAAPWRRSLRSCVLARVRANVAGERPHGLKTRATAGALSRNGVSHRRRNVV